MVVFLLTEHPPGVAARRGIKQTYRAALGFLPLVTLFIFITTKLQHCLSLAASMVRSNHPLS